MKKTIQKLLDLADGLGWEVSVDNDPEDPGINFQRYSSAGQDFNIYLRVDNSDIGMANPDALVEALADYANDYDPSEEAIKWADENGHGMNGAPHELKDIIADTEDCKRMLLELLTAWRNGFIDEKEEPPFETLKKRLAKHTDSFENPGYYEHPSGPAELYDTLLAIKTLIETGTLIENKDLPLTENDLEDIPE